MKSVLILAAMAVFSFPHASMANPSDQPGSGDTALTSEERGEAKGHVVVWRNAHSGKPTAHLEGRLYDDCGRLFATVVARLEDNGCVSGTAYTNHGCEELSGEWCFDKYDAEGKFEIEFDYCGCEIELEGEFCGWRTKWETCWEKDCD